MRNSLMAEDTTNIFDMQWASNDLSLVVVFANSAFCIISRLGQILHFATGESFHAAKCGPLTLVSLRDSTLYLESKSQIAKLELKGLPNEYTFFGTPNPLSRVNSLLHTFVVNPQFSLDPRAPQLLYSLIDEDLVSLRPAAPSKSPSQPRNNDRSLIEFVNPFTEVVAADECEVVKDLAKLLEPLKWGELPVNVLEAVVGELMEAKKILLPGSA